MPTVAQQRYRTLAALHDAAAYVDCHAHILAANDAFQDVWMLCGAERGSIQGRTVLTIFADADHQWVRETLGEAEPLARPSSRSARLAGLLATTKAEFLPIRRPGANLFWLVTLRSSHSPCAFDDALRSAFTAGIVHDLRSPLQLVLGWTSILRRARSDPARTEQALEIVERNARLQAALLDHLLEFLRPSCSRGDLSLFERQHVDLFALVDAELQALQPLADERGVRVSLKTDASEIAIEGADVHLRRVVANLVGNALKFTPPGGAIECRVWRSVGWAGLVVRDTGRGIERDRLPHVFDVFRQSSRQSPTDGEGLGLGLSIVRHLVELHGGTVTAASAGPGCGATFTVLLPAVPHLPPGDVAPHAALVAPTRGRTPAITAVSVTRSRSEAI